MITAEIKINGMLLYHVYCTNSSKVSIADANDDRYHYEYEVYEIGKGKVHSGKLVHNRDGGGAKLISDILKNYYEA